MADWLSIAPAVCVKPLWIDDGREVHLVDAHGIRLALKQWEKERLEAEGNSAQVCIAGQLQVHLPLDQCAFV
jgi:hypothetical protein